MTDEAPSDEASRWRANAAAYDAWFDQPWGRYASSGEHDLLLDATGPVAGLEVCDAGIAFLPGSAGTAQEIFQDACENFYADESSVALMVLVGRGYWTEEMPAWPLLRQIARGHPMESAVHLVDTVEEAAALMAGD